MSQNSKYSFKNVFMSLALVMTWGLEYSFAREGGSRPPPYNPGNPGRPGPRPEPRPPGRPEPRPPVRPEPRPPVRPEPRPPRPYPPRPYPQPRPPRPYPPRPAPVDYTIVLDVYRTISGYQTINLGDYFNFYQYAGFEVDAVQVTVSSDSGPMELSFLANRNVEDSRALSYGYSNVMFYPYNHLVLRSNVQELQLMARGSGYVRIERVVLYLSY